MDFGLSGTKRTVRNGEVSVRRGSTVVSRLSYILGRKSNYKLVN